MKIGIMGAGKIAHTMAKTIVNMHDNNIILEAIGSRNIRKAQEFQNQYNIKKAYGSYLDLVNDNDLDLIYIATPHSEHFNNANLCLDHNKHCLIEKPMCVNYKEAKYLFDKANQKGLLLTEAIWTRYMPSAKFFKQIIASQIIGEVNSVEASLGYNLVNVPRLNDPYLAGGALLDVGIYPLTFACLVFNSLPIFVDGNCVKTKNNLDASDNITLIFENNKIACLHATMISKTSRKGFIYGSKGYLVVDNINNPSKVSHYDNDDHLINELSFPKQITGFEYQILECFDAINNKHLECQSVKQIEVLTIMQTMDTLRKKWGIIYPFEKEEDL
ncbi:MAG: Gfo/Idh/MocA family oxidoreductase [Bacilli bacterium]|nr:Gfo/Idh/MocA family oxidoreductase [Bacilli bacterium]